MTVFDGTLRGYDYWGEISIVDRSTIDARFAARITRVVHYNTGRAQDLPVLRRLHAKYGASADEARLRAIHELEMAIGGVKFS